MLASRRIRFVRHISLWIGLCAFLWLEPGLALALAGPCSSLGGPLLPTEPTHRAIAFTAPGSAAQALAPLVSDVASYPTLDPQIEPTDDDGSPSPFFKRAWFLIAAVGAVALAVVLITTTGDDGKPAGGGEPLPGFPPPPSSSSSVSPQGCAR